MRDIICVISTAGLGADGKNYRVGQTISGGITRLSSVSSLCNRDGCRVEGRLAIASTLSRKYLLHHNVPEIPPDRKSVHHIRSASRRTVDRTKNAHRLSQPSEAADSDLVRLINRVGVIHRKLL